MYYANRLHEQKRLIANGIGIHFGQLVNTINTPNAITITASSGISVDLETSLLDQ